MRRLGRTLAINDVQGATPLWQQMLRKAAEAAVVVRFQLIEMQ